MSVFELRNSKEMKILNDWSKFTQYAATYG
jgi:hypothetical protein